MWLMKNASNVVKKLVQTCRLFPLEPIDSWPAVFDTDTGSLPPAAVSQFWGCILRRTLLQTSCITPARQDKSPISWVPLSASDEESFLPNMSQDSLGPTGLLLCNVNFLCIYDIQTSVDHILRRMQPIIGGTAYICWDDAQWWPVPVKADQSEQTWLLPFFLFLYLETNCVPVAVSLTNCFVHAVYVRLKSRIFKIFCT